MGRGLSRTATAAAGVLVLAGSLLAGTAGAAGAADAARSAGPTLECFGVPGLEDSTTATGVSTAVQGPATSSGTAQVRTGYANGVQYGWGRVVGGSGGRSVVFEVDIDGDRVWDCAAWTHSTAATIWTTGTQTSSSSSRAFRACVVPNWELCSSSVAVSITPWW
ncbi:hypothetical protein [Streptomyces sp. NPDC088794]|uniref:hypothetical protein n=1 Tax=Streptomyces sp. NPDC088794 TaxID=3365902 RepID=UPI0037FAAEF8